MAAKRVNTSHFTCNFFMPPFLIAKNDLICRVSSYLFPVTADEKNPPLCTVKVHIFIWGQSKQREQCCVCLPGITQK